VKNYVHRIVILTNFAEQQNSQSHL